MEIPLITTPWPGSGAPEHVVSGRKRLREVRDGLVYSPDRATAMAAFERFTTKWIISEERAVRCLAEKIDRCLTFYDYPKVDWSKIRTNNVAERAFRFVRQRQRPMGAFTNEESAERIFGALGGEWNRRRSHPLAAIYTT